MPRAKAVSDTQPALQGYYRFPALHGDRIVFVSDDDLWVVGVAGGIASRLTTGKGQLSRPVFSPDGRWIAFQGLEEGVPEIYVIPGEGGEPRRITFLGAQTYPVGWTPDGGEILFVSDTGQPFMMDQHLYAVPRTGGPHRALNVGPARAIALEPGGRGVLLARNGGDPARWKRYRGGTAGTLWLDADGRGAFRQILPDLKGNLASPMWLDGRLYFLSDHEGIGNLYSVRAAGRGPVVRHTQQDEFYARFPATDGNRIVYHAGADLFLFDPRTGPALLCRCPVETPAGRAVLAHEYCHLLADVDPYENRACLPAAAAARGSPTPRDSAVDLAFDELDVAELRAELFARAFLLPADHYRQTLASFGVRPAADLALPRLADVAYYYGVETALALRRLADLGLIAASDRDALLGRLPGNGTDAWVPEPGPAGTPHPGLFPAPATRFVNLSLALFIQRRISLEQMAYLLGIEPAAAQRFVAWSEAPPAPIEKAR